MRPQTVLRVEGLGIFLFAIAAYGYVDGPWWLLLLLALAPDLSMLGYLAGTRWGSFTYNLAHTYTVPLAVLGVGFLAGIDLVVFGSLVWIAHIGADRAVGYGLKYDTGFKDTHLSTQPPPVAQFAGDD